MPNLCNLGYTFNDEPSYNHSAVIYESSRRPAHHGHARIA
jgi:hypothetical protein